MKLLTLKNTAGLIVLAGILTTASCGFDSDNYAIYVGGRRYVTRPSVHHGQRSPAHVRRDRQARYNVSHRRSNRRLSFSPPRRRSGRSGGRQRR